MSQWYSYCCITWMLQSGNLTAGIITATNIKVGTVVQLYLLTTANGVGIGTAAPRAAAGRYSTY